MEVIDTTGAWGGKAICPNCMAHIPYLLPLEPLYDIQLAAPLIPMSQVGLRGYLSRHKADYPRRYRKDRHRVLHRMLTASEIRRIRKDVIRFKNLDGTRRDGGEFGE